MSIESQKRVDTPRRWTLKGNWDSSGPDCRWIETTVEGSDLEPNETVDVVPLAELRDLQRQYDELSEQTGSAIVRAHVARGNRELDAAKLAEELDAARAALREIRDAEVPHSSIPPDYDSRSCSVCELQRIAREALGGVK